MTLVTSTSDPLPLLIPYQPMRMSVTDYHKLIADGTLTKNRRIELLRGVMTEKMTHNPLHAALIGIVQTLLNSLSLSGVHVRTQVPITLTDSEPEPDISVARGKLTDYLARHPGPSDVELVVEIAYSSLVTDRFKGEIYAEAKIPIYWIVNLVKRRVEVYSNPTITAAGPCYADCREFQPGEMIPVFVDDREVGTLSAADLLPPVDAQ